MSLNRESYDAIASHWHAARQQASVLEGDFLDRLLHGLAPGSPILDLGCGTGHPLGTMVVARGFALTGVDQSEGMLAIARAQLPTARFVHSAIETFETSERFNAVICWDALFHIERTHHAPILRNIFALLAPGGRFICTVGGSAHPAFTDTMFDRTFFYDSHTPDETLALLESVGLTPVHHDYLNAPTSGRDKGRFGILAQRAR